MAARDSLIGPGAPGMPVLPAPQAFDSFGSDEDSGWLRDAFRVLRERRRVIVGVLALCAVPLGVYSVVVPSVRLFEARAQMLVEPQAPPPLETANASYTGPENSYYETQYRLLRSRSLARRSLSTLTSKASPSPGDVDGFLRGLVIVHIPDSRLLEVRFRSEDAAYAARAVNAHTDSFIRESQEFARSSTGQTSKWITRQIEEQRGRVEAAEAAVLRYERDHGALESRRVIASQRLSDLNGAVQRAREARASRETTYQQAVQARRAGRSSRDLAALVATPVLQQLSMDLAGLQRQDVELAAQYGERHPERVKVGDAIKFTESRLDAEVTRAIETMARQVASAREDERQAMYALSAQSAESSAVGRSSVSYDALKTDLANDRALLDKLQQRAREMTLSRDYDPTSVRVIDAAEVPRSPLPDAKWRNVMLGSGGALALALLLAFGLHYLDERVRSPEDIKAHLGLPCLGMVPKLSPAAPGASRGAHAAGITRMALPRSFREAMRALRTQVLCTPAGQASRIVLVASAGMQEGKTLVATNLAAGLAQVGYRVLLIDLDLRQPSVHRAFDTPVQPGLSELLSGRATAAESIRPTTVRDLWVLTAGRPLSNPGDLLGSSAFSRMLKSLPSSFDRIVLDSPPVMAFTDASLIAHEQAGIVFVVSADRTGRRAAQAALERLEAVGARFVGAVLNRVARERVTDSSYFRDDDDEETYVEYATVPSPSGGGAAPIEQETSEAPPQTAQMRRGV
jgi:succinoglycan biosynthesis transport protein ExoP